MEVKITGNYIRAEIDVCPIMITRLHVESLTAQHTGLVNNKSKGYTSLPVVCSGDSERKKS